jgi:hypothetical protein
MGQHGQRHNTGTCFSVSSDDKLVLFLFPGIPTGDPAIVAFYDTKDKFKFGAINQFTHIIVSSSIDVSTLLLT